MVSNFVQAIIGAGGAILGSAVSGVIFYRSMKKREEEETKRRRAEAYVEEKRERLIELNESIIDVQDCVTRISANVLKLDTIESNIDDVDERADKKLETMEEFFEHRDDLLERTEELRQSKAYTAAFLSPQQTSKIDQAADSLAWYAIQSEKEIEKYDWAVDDLREFAVEQIAQEIEDEYPGGKEEMSDDKIAELQDVFSNRFVEQVERAVDDMEEDSDIVLYEATADELEDVLEKKLKRQLIPIPNNFKEATKMTNYHLRLARDEVENALSEPVDYFAPND